MTRLVVMIEDDDGNRDVWDVFNADEVSWDWAGSGRNGSRARVVVEGDFHRRHQTLDGRELSAKMRKALR